MLPAFLSKSFSISGSRARARSRKQLSRVAAAAIAAAACAGVSRVILCECICRAGLSRVLPIGETSKSSYVFVRDLARLSRRRPL